MKSIFKYVTCFCGEAAAVEVAEASRKEEAEFIVVVPSPLRETKRQKSRRHGTAKPAAFADQNCRKYSRLQWQPALSAISENKVATERELVSAVVGGPEKIILHQPKLERSNNTGSNKKAAASSKVYASNYSDNSWREGSRSPLMPSLSPPIFAF